MSESSSSSSSGIGFCGLLTIVFITLKLLGKIGWSWWWVLSPLWIGVTLTLLIVVGFLGVAGTVAIVSAGMDRRRARKRRQLITADRERYIPIYSKTSENKERK